MSAPKFRVAVLMGGMSSEREVSLSSGAECAAALERLGHEVIRIDADTSLAEKLTKAKPDIALNALHGRYGEDGIVQGLLELMQIPYTHSGVLASSLAMDKEKSKLIYRDVGIPVAASKLVGKDEARRAHPLPPPYVIKPYNEGSSVGVYIVAKGANRPADISADMPDILMAEEYIAGRELTVSVLGDRALCVTEIVTDGWYDYEAKYAEGGSRHVLPADIPSEIEARCLEYALKAHEALGCRGLTRSDFRYDEAKGGDGLFILETNTQPGMTPTSLAPEQAAHCGTPFDALISWLIEDASCQR